MSQELPAPDAALSAVSPGEPENPPQDVEWAATLSTTLYDYAKFAYAKMDENRINVIKRANEIAAFSSVTSTMILFLFKDAGTFMTSHKYGQVIVTFITFSAVCFILSLALAVIVLRMKQQKFLPRITDVLSAVHGGIISDTQIKWMTVEAMAEAAEDFEHTAEREACILALSHALLTAGVSFVFISTMTLIATSQ